jgi:ABC-type glycerol-3-phosphate transport system substrate-binding protein
MSKFQIVLLGVFGVFIIVAVFVFALYRGSSSTDVAVTVWGSLPSEDFRLLLNTKTFIEDQSLVITYEEKSAATIESEFTEALAQGIGPDLIILRQDQFYKNKAKLLPIPYTSLNARDFQETFVEAGEIYLMPEGVYGLPLIADPLVLYYNRDLLSAAGTAKPISYWDEIYAEIGNLSKRDAAGNLIKSAIALGETRNIANTKDILSLLLLQAGTPITTLVNGELTAVLGNNPGLPVAPADSALEFYTQFSNPTKTFYSWNRILPEAQNRFTSGDLAYYLGFASELRALRNKNPTLNFSVSLVPQSRVSGKSLTVARLYSLSISRGVKNAPAALKAATKIVGSASAAEYSRVSVLPPARRDLLSNKPSDSIMPVFYNASLQSRSWIDPNAAGTGKIFSDLVESITSGRARVSEAVDQAMRSLENLI